jgi:antirestriction protein ArdC
LTPNVRQRPSWSKVLKDDKRAIFTAAWHAQRAAVFLHGLHKPDTDADSSSPLGGFAEASAA